MTNLPILYDGDMVYLKDGRAGVFLKDCELIDERMPFPEYRVHTNDIIQLFDSDEFIYYNMMDPEDIKYFMMNNETYDVASAARLIISLTAKELKSKYRGH